MLTFFKEFKRRKMFRPLVAYAAFAFALIQVCSIVFPALLLPQWTNTFIVVLVIIGFPITVFFAWVYDITPEGIQKTPFTSTSTEDGKKSSKIIFPITGFLTIIGGAFWIWYSLGDITSGSVLDLQMGIKKSIAVLDFNNFTGQKEGNHTCSAISVHIRNVLSGIGKLDVKSRRAILDNNPRDLELDYYIEGELTEIGGRRNINVTIVNAKSESNLWAGGFEFKDEEIVAYQDTIIQNILTKLKVEPIGNELTSSTRVYKNPETFNLIGEGIYHFEQKKYYAAIEAFNSVLKIDPENIVASYHKAKSYFELNNFKDAMIIYERILDKSIEIDPIQWRMPIPEKKDVHPILCDNIELIEENDLAIMLLKGDKVSRMICLNTSSGKISWENPIDDKFISNPVIINNTVFLTSSRIKKEQAGEPTLHAYNISNGRKIFIDEFSRENQNQAVLLTILEEYNKKVDDNSSILLLFNKLGHIGESRKELALIETTSGRVVWESKIDLEWGFWLEFMLINQGGTELLLLILENDIIALNHKTGIEMWRENFSGSGVFVWNQKIFQINTDEKYVALWDPISRKQVWQSYNKREYMFNAKLGINEFRGRMNRDVILLNFSDGGLVALNYDGGLFNWRRVRWDQNVGLAEKIWFSQNMSNHVFCLTAEDSLFTINMADGNIINRLATDGPGYSVYFDNSKNAMVLNNSEFLVGVDPINGDQLWKIKDVGVDKMALVGNSALAARTVLEDSLFLINAYNRDNGNLIGSRNIDISEALSYLPVMGPMCGVIGCAFCVDFSFYLEPNSDESLLLVMHDEIRKMGVLQGESVAVRQKDVQLQIARTYEKNGQLNSSIKEYKQLLLRDQLNQDAHWELANIYQKTHKVNEAAKSLINYYDLILPESSEGALTIQKLKDLSVLRWEKNISQHSYDAAKMGVDNERVFLFLDSNIEAHSLYSSALIWKKNIGDENTSIMFENVKNERHIFFIKKDIPDPKRFYLTDMLADKRLDFEAYEKASKYSLTAMDKRTGYVSWDVTMDIPGESDVAWMGVTENKIFIQSIVQKKLFISAYDIGSGDLFWKISRDISSFYTSFDLSVAIYKENLLLPLNDRIEYINAETGSISMTYTNEDIDQIYFFNQNSVQGHTMQFVVEDMGIDYEYVVVDLDKNIKSSSGPLSLDNPELGVWINDLFVDITSSGSVSTYKLPEDIGHEVAVQWHRNFNSSLEFVGVDKQKIYLLDMYREYVIVVDAQSGRTLQSKPLLGLGKNVELTNHYFIVQSKNKLFVVPM